MVNKQLILTIVLFFSVASYADYQFEAQGELGLGGREYEYEYEDNWFSEDDNFDYDLSSNYIEGKIYFSAIGAGNVPYREAGFLSQNGFVQLSRQYNSTKSDDYDYSDYESTLYRIEAQHVFSDFGLIISAGYIDGESEQTSEQTTVDIGGYNVGAGYYITDKISLRFIYEVIDGDDDSDAEYRKIRYHQVVGGGAHQFGIKGETEINSYEEDGDSLDEFVLGGSFYWYFRNKLSLGASIRITSQEHDEVESLSSRIGPYVQYDFNEHFGIYSRIESEFVEYEIDDYVDVSSFSIETSVGLVGRF